jgi:sterol desaturase/sphingolipid hydroxylase (fatty acid hydroxylase superfamily)
MDVETLSFLRLTTVLGVLGLLLVIESWTPFRASIRSRFRHIATNLSIAGSNAVVVNLLFSGMLILVSRQTEGWGLLHYLGLGSPANVAASVVLLDLTFYGFHWANHIIPFLWRFHRAHHSDLELDVTTAFRFHLGEVLISMLIKAMAVILLGIPVIGLLLFETLLVAAAEFQHSNLRLPEPIDKRLRLLVITPHMHWIHHSRLPLHHNSNFGTIFSGWDRLFHTYFLQVRQEDVRIGLEQYSAHEQVGFSQFYAMPFKSGVRSHL